MLQFGRIQIIQSKKRKTWKLISSIWLHIECPEKGKTKFGHELQMLLNWRKNKQLHLLEEGMLGQSEFSGITQPSGEAELFWVVSFRWKQQEIKPCSFSEEIVRKWSSSQTSFLFSLEKGTTQFYLNFSSNIHTSRQGWRYALSVSETIIPTWQKEFKEME